MNIISVLLIYFLDDLKLQLSKYLLRTLCTDMTNQVVKYLAEDCKLAVSDNVDTFNKVSTYYNNCL